MDKKKIILYFYSHSYQFEDYIHFFFFLIYFKEVSFSFLLKKFVSQFLDFFGWKFTLILGMIRNCFYLTCAFIEFGIFMCLHFYYTSESEK